MKGSCLCGQVQFEFTGPVKQFQYCHCTRCQKVTGSAHASNLFVNESQFVWVAGQALVGRFEHPQAKYYATCFCKICGSSLPWVVQGGGNLVIPAGSLDDPPEISPSQSVFWGSHAPWYVSPSELPKHDELPPRKTK